LLNHRASRPRIHFHRHNHNPKALLANRRLSSQPSQVHSDNLPHHLRAVSRREQARLEQPPLPPLDFNRAVPSLLEMLLPAMRRHQTHSRQSFSNNRTKVSNPDFLPLVAKSPIPALTRRARVLSTRIRHHTAHEMLPTG
jgi:hypothetical protein